MCNIKVSCPYCSNDFEVPCNQSLGVITDHKEVQYTRDIGRFDPSSESDWFKTSSWRKVGNDFVPYWEKIGILRISKPDIIVYYKVQGCPSCKNLFDIYVNYTPNVNLESIWKHLFGLNESNKVIPYEGNSLITWLISFSQKIFKSKLFSIIIIVLSVLTFSLSPWLFFNQEGKIVFDNPIFIFNFSQKLLISFCLVLLLYYIDSYITFFKKANNFEHLFSFLNENSITHWKNYTLSRFIGVQDNPNKPSLNQIDIVVGSISILLLIITFIFAKFSNLVAVKIVALLFAYIFAHIAFKKFKLNHKINITFTFISTVFIVLIIYYTYVVQFSTNAWDFINSIVDLLFWFYCMFIIGSSIWMALNTITYILKGISKNPLNISPFDNYRNANILRKMQEYSQTLMVIVFVSIVILLSTQPLLHNFKLLQSTDLYFSNQEWLGYFLVIVIGVIISALSYGSNQVTYIYIVFFYALILIILSYNQITFFNRDISVYSIVVALFFTTVMLYQYYTSEKIIHGILQSKKEEVMNELSKQVDNFNFRLGNIQYNTSDIFEISNYEQLRYTCIKSLESLINIFKELNSPKIAISRLQNLFKITSPIITAIIINGLLKPLIEKFDLLNIFIR